MHVTSPVAPGQRFPGSSGGTAVIPPPHAADLAAFVEALGSGGLSGALAFLNARTPHRFSGVFRFDGDMLRSVALFDKWDPEVQAGEDLPVADAYCAHLRGTGENIEVSDGRRDARVSWMSASPVVSYCGALIQDANHAPWGALCHFDTAPCQAKSSDMPLLTAAAALLHGAASAAGAQG
jgi:hypothetical protein